MHMELRAHPDDAMKLARLPGLTREGTGRPRSRPVRLVWHDSPDHALRADGLSLHEARGVWRVEPLDTRQVAWPPATAAPVLHEGASLDLLGMSLPPMLAPVVAFHGRSTSHALIVAGDAVTLTVLRGAIRRVTDEHPACRVVLEGPDEAVRALACILAQAARVAPAAATLGTEALVPSDAPLWLEPASVSDPDLPPGSAFRLILGGLLRAILARAPRILSGTGSTEAVHQMRVAVRRARSAITVFRPAIASPALHQASQHLKTLGGQLGPTRDWDVCVTETLPEVMAALPDHPTLAALDKACERRRRESRLALVDYLSSPAFRVLTTELAWLAAAGDWLPSADPTTDLRAFAAQVLHRRARKVVVAGRKFESLDIPALHAMRLRAKRTRYAAEVFAPLFSGRHAPRYLRRLARLQQALGVLNDGAVADGLLGELGGARGRHAHASGIVTGFIAYRGASIRPSIEAAFEKFRRTEPFWA